MRSDLLSLLICPACRSGGLELVVTARDSREVRAGLLFCPHCAARYSIENGIVDLLDNPPEEILREQQGWLKLLGATGPELDSQMLGLPYLDHEHWWPYAANFDGLLEHIRLDGARVLDVGSGRAWSARWLLRHGAREVVATDILRQKYIGLETADLFFNADGTYFERVLCDMETMPFASACFDAVFSTASLHHALDLRRTFVEISRMLHPGGGLFLTSEPVRPSNMHVDMSDSAEAVVGINEHIYAIEEWVEAAESAGFAVQLLMPRWIERAHAEGRLDQALAARPAYDYLPRLLGSPRARRLLSWQPLLFNAYRDYGLPLVLVAHKRYDLPAARANGAGSIIAQNAAHPGATINQPRRRPPMDRAPWRSPALQGGMLRAATGLIGRLLAVARNPIDALRSWKTARDQRRPLRSALPLNSTIERYVIHGLYPIERGVDGRPFCWTAPAAELVLRRPARTRTLRLQVALPPVPRCLTVAIDGIPVGSIHSEHSESIGPWRDITFDLPPTKARQATISLQLDQPWSPAEVWQSTDTRTLGIALAELAYA